jgi:Flp pilus assembly protein TadG
MAALTNTFRRLRSQRGAELIELMLVAPILMMFLAGIFDFGMLFRTWEVVTNAAREGARVGTLPDYTADADVVTRVEQYMQSSGVAASCSLQTLSGNRCDATVNGCSVCVSVRNDFTGPGGATFKARSVTVTTRQPMSSLSWITALIGGSFNNVLVGSTSVMRAEAAAAGS